MQRYHAITLAIDDQQQHRKAPNEHLTVEHTHTRTQTHLPFIQNIQWTTFGVEIEMVGLSTWPNNVIDGERQRIKKNIYAHTVRHVLHIVLDEQQCAHGGHLNERFVAIDR